MLKQNKTILCNIILTIILIFSISGCNNQEDVTFIYEKENLQPAETNFKSKNSIKEYFVCKYDEKKTIYFDNENKIQINGFKMRLTRSSSQIKADVSLVKNLNIIVCYYDVNKKIIEKIQTSYDIFDLQNEPNINYNYNTNAYYFRILEVSYNTINLINDTDIKILTKEKYVTKKLTFKQCSRNKFEVNIEEDNYYLLLYNDKKQLITYLQADSYIDFGSKYYRIVSIEREVKNDT